jgi:hypothetical protein
MADDNQSRVQGMTGDVTAPVNDVVVACKELLAMAMNGEITSLIAFCEVEGDGVYHGSAGDIDVKAILWEVECWKADVMRQEEPLD